MTDWLTQAELALDASGPVQAAFGFSFGALIALLLAARGRFPSAVIAASPSPYLKELLPRLPPIAERVLGRRRMQDFEKYRIGSVKQVKSSKVRVVVGGNDFAQLVSFSKRLPLLIPSADVNIVPGAEHDLGDARYLAEVERLVKSI